MMPNRMSIEITKESRRILRNLAKSGKLDLRPTLHVIGIGYRREVGAIFDKQQPRTEGERWEPLSTDYAARKQREWGDRPILVASGSLLASMTVKGATGNITVIDKDKATFGSSLAYAAVHDEGTEQAGRNRDVTIPQRNFSEPSERRADIWKKQINDALIFNFARNGIVVTGGRVVT